VEGTISEAFRALNGAPTFSYATESFLSNDSHDKVSAIIVQAQIENFPMGATLSVEGFSKLFIYKGNAEEDPTFRFKMHHVIIMGVFKVEKDGAEVVLIHLRNPWTKFEYRGPYAEEESFWTEEVKKQMPLQYNEFGSFYIDVASFV